MHFQQQACNPFHSDTYNATHLLHFRTVVKQEHNIRSNFTGSDTEYTGDIGKNPTGENY